MTAGGWGDRWDIVYGSGSINRDRMKRLYMTQPYYATPNLFFVRADSPYQTADQLSGKQIGACASCSHEYYLKHELEIPGVTLEYDIKDPVVVAFETEGPGLQALADGKIDAFLAAAPVGAGADRRGPAPPRPRQARLHVLPSGFVDRSSGLDVVAFTDRVNQIIRARQADGTLKALSEQFFGHDYVAKAAAFDLSTIGQTIP